MEENFDEKEIKKLAETFLRIPKEVRLTGNDGFIHIPAVPDLFYINEIVVWLVNLYKPNAENRLQYGDFLYDYTIEAKGYNRIKNYPDVFLELKPGKHEVKDSKRVTLIEVYNGLNEQQLLKTNLGVNEYLLHSFSHQRFLYRILNTLHSQSGAFMSILAERLGVPITSTNEFYNISLNCLGAIQNVLLNEELKGKFCIPELYGMRDHGVLMSYSLNEVLQYENEQWGLLYTYKFSKTTSYHFLMALKRFLSILVNRYESLQVSHQNDIPKDSKSPNADQRLIEQVSGLIKKADESSKERVEHLAKRVEDKLSVSVNDMIQQVEKSSQERVDESLIRKPTDTKEKVNLILELLSITEQDKMEEGELDVISTIILIKALCENNIFRKKIPKYHLSMAYHILTGYSYTHFDKKFPANEIDWDVLKKLYKSPTNKKKPSVAIEKLIQTLEEKIIPYLSALKP